MEQTLLPVGLRRDGSLYTRIEWASHTAVAYTHLDVYKRQPVGILSTGDYNKILHKWQEICQTPSCFFHRHFPL